MDSDTFLAVTIPLLSIIGNIFFLIIPIYALAVPQNRHKIAGAYTIFLCLSLPVIGILLGLSTLLLISFGCASQAICTEPAGNIVFIVTVIIGFLIFLSLSVYALAKRAKIKNWLIKSSVPWIIAILTPLLIGPVALLIFVIFMLIGSLAY